jgi:hypothetical protein
VSTTETNQFAEQFTVPERHTPVPAGTNRSWLVVGASVQGVSHKKLNMPCQDAQDYQVLPNGVLIVVVADGAGTAERSDEGARYAASEARRTLVIALEESQPEDPSGWDDLLRCAVKQARQVLVYLADEQGDPLRSFASTLTLAVVSEGFLAVAQLGDGAVVAGSAEGGLFAATQTQRGEYANETYFLTQEDALEQVQVAVYDMPVDRLAVMSDGLLRLALNVSTNEPHAPFFEPLFAFTASAQEAGQPGEKLAAFLDSERVRARTDDDKTIVLAVRAE